MKRSTWTKHHKWFGLIFTFFILMFCLSGIILNHRETVSYVDVSRKWLPSRYRFNSWNNGLLRGSLCCVRADSMLLYGSNGIWITDSVMTSFRDFNDGLPSGTDHRNIRAVVQATGKNLFAVSPFALYRRDGKVWKEICLPDRQEERLSDLTLAGDTLVVTGRSYLYISSFPYHDFRKVKIKAPADYDGKVSLFRTVWLLHSGELFGTYGKLLMDGVAVVIMILCFSGVFFWLLRRVIRRTREKGRSVVACVSLLKGTFGCHDTVGRYTFFLLMWVAFTGWCLRPPVLIALVYGKVPPIPGTMLDEDNAWNDKLRMVRYDREYGDWLLSTSEGFYSLSSLDTIPIKVLKAPPVSVMGLNVWQKNGEGRWMAGSFSGMFVWNRTDGKVFDFFTGDERDERVGPPFGKRAVSGCIAGMKSAPIIVEYEKGTASVPMPDEFAEFPISLWSLALEIHTGRIYTSFGQGALIYIFFVGLAAMWCVYTGFIIAIRRANRHN